MSGVVTQMRFDIDSPTPKLFFRPVRGVEEDEWEIIERVRNSEDAMKAIEMAVFQTDEVKGDDDEAPNAGYVAPVEKPGNGDLFDNNPR